MSKPTGSRALRVKVWSSLARLPEARLVDGVRRAGA